MHRRLSRSRPLTVIALGVTALGVTAGAGAARNSSGSTATTKPPSALVLTVAEGETVSPVDQMAMLRCTPTRGGDHPRAAEACAALTRASGRFFELSPTISMFCIQIYDPVTVTASGVWGGKLKYFSRKYGNSCEMHNATWPMFAFYTPPTR